MPAAVSPVQQGETVGSEVHTALHAGAPVHTDRHVMILPWATADAARHFADLQREHGVAKRLWRRRGT